MEIGEVLIKPLSALRVRLPLTRISQLGSPPVATVIQQQEAKLKGRVAGVVNGT